MSDENKENLIFALKATGVYILIAVFIWACIILIDWVSTHVVIFSLIAGIIIIAFSCWIFRFQIKRLLSRKSDKPNNIDDYKK
jgi:hypothetical protein